MTPVARKRYLIFIFASVNRNWPHCPIVKAFQIRIRQKRIIYRKACINKVKVDQGIDDFTVASDSFTPGQKSAICTNKP